MNRHLANARKRKVMAPVEPQPMIPFSQRFQGKISHVSRSGLMEVLMASKQILNTLQNEKSSQVLDTIREKRKNSLASRVNSESDKQNLPYIKNVTKSARQSLSKESVKLPPISRKGNKEAGSLLSKTQRQEKRIIFKRDE